MKTTQLMTEEKLLELAVQALLDKLGPLETLRFLSLPHKQRMESVKRHQKWQRQLDQETFFHEVFP